MVADTGREARHPFLAEAVVDALLATPLHLVADLRLPPGAAGPLDRPHPPPTLFLMLCRRQHCRGWPSDDVLSGASNHATAASCQLRSPAFRSAYAAMQLLCTVSWLG